MLCALHPKRSLHQHVSEYKQSLIDAALSSTVS